MSPYFPMAHKSYLPKSVWMTAYDPIVRTSYISNFPLCCTSNFSDSAVMTTRKEHAVQLFKSRSEGSIAEWSAVRMEDPLSCTEITAAADSFKHSEQFLHARGNETVLKNNREKQNMCVISLTRNTCYLFSSCHISPKPCFFINVRKKSQ